MAVISWQKAKNLVVVDPDTGIQIPHVKSVDPQAGWLEVYSTTPCAPSEGMEMVFITNAPDGSQVTERFFYTFVDMRDPATGQKYRLTARHHGRYDLVDRYSGEVVNEVRGPRFSKRVRAPEKWVRQYQFMTLGRHSSTAGYQPPGACS